jgi:hypothetical protein
VYGREGIGVKRRGTEPNTNNQQAKKTTKFIPGLDRTRNLELGTSNFER